MPRPSELPQRDDTEYFPVPEITPQIYPTPEKGEQVPIEIINGALEEIYQEEREEEEDRERKHRPTLH